MPTQAESLLAGKQLEDGCVLEHSALEVLVLTQCWGRNSSFALRCLKPASMCHRSADVQKRTTRLLRLGFPGLMCRCSQLRTLVVALDKVLDRRRPSDLCELENIIAGLPALATGAPVRAYAPTSRSPVARTWGTAQPDLAGAGLGVCGGGACCTQGRAHRA